MEKVVAQTNTHNSIVCDQSIVIVTGYSGAGKSTVLRALEDNGYLCIDNLPSALLQSFFSLIDEAKIPDKKIALGVDIRSGHTAQQLIEELNILGAWRSRIKIFFLMSSAPVLIKRFQETRRQHPLGQSRAITEAIEQERQLMNPLQEIADVIIDTDQLTIHQLRSLVRQSCCGDGNKILVNFISFGFKYGVPLESNFVYDVTCLPNPYFIAGLRDNIGTDDEIQRYLFEQQQVQDYWQKLFDMICYAIARSYEQGRYFMTIAIGCTGGRHRSVAFVHRLSQHSFEHAVVVCKHRDIHNDHY